MHIASLIHIVKIWNTYYNQILIVQAQIFLKIAILHAFLNKWKKMPVFKNTHLKILDGF